MGLPKFIKRGEKEGRDKANRLLSIQYWYEGSFCIPTIIKGPGYWLKVLTAQALLSPENQAAAIVILLDFGW